MPSYHDIYVTTAKIPRTSIFNLPYGMELTCTRVAGWRLWDNSNSDPPYMRDSQLIAGEYENLSKWLIVDVNGHIIVDSRREAEAKG